MLSEPYGIQRCAIRAAVTLDCCLVNWMLVIHRPKASRPLLWRLHHEIFPAVTIVQILHWLPRCRPSSGNNIGHGQRSGCDRKRLLRLAIAADGAHVSVRGQGHKPRLREYPPQHSRSVYQAGFQCVRGDPLGIRQRTVGHSLRRVCVRAVVRVESEKHYVVFEVLSLEGEDIEELAIADIELKLAEARRNRSWVVRWPSIF